jgi:DNA-binding transcriptional MerR regulator
VERRYTTGRFAQRASVSVRTLRFYDNAGLLRPAERSEAGYRRYSEEDLPRLQQVLALKFLGLSLDEIKRCLATGPDRLQESLGRQKAMLREKRAQLDLVLRAIEEAERHLTTEQSTIESVVRLIEVIQMQQQNDWVNKYLTPEQQEKLEELRDGAYSESARTRLAARGPWTEQDQTRASAQWAAIGNDLRRLVAAGADPRGPEGQTWAASFNALIAEFTQNDPEIEAGLNTFWQRHDALPASERPLGPTYSAEEQAFMNEALSASRQP